MLGCGDDAGPRERDAAPPPDEDSGVAQCEQDAECDDGRACNGVERCAAGRCVAGQEPRCDDGLACTYDECSERLGRCVFTPPDQDGDGHFAADCVDAQGEPLGTDCDDSDAQRFPGNLELCDAADHDEDCDPTSYGSVDVDADGSDDARCCNGTACGDDCDDLRPGVNRTTSEVCDGFDNDCDGKVDEDVSVALYVDADYDGHGAIGAPTAMGCAGRPGFAISSDDCDDTDPSRRPSLVELCDADKDNDCNPATTDVDAQPTEWYRDADGDGFGDATDFVLSCAPQSGRVLLSTDCNDADSAIHPAAAEVCDGVDNDCAGGANFAIGPNDFEDDDGDGVVDSACGGTDCDDRDALTGGSGVAEVCDGRDNDCDGRTDEDVTEQVWFRDADADGYGSLARGAISACTHPIGYSARADDCDDDDKLRNPGQKESCNARDDDCDSKIDEAPVPDTDGDGVCNALDLCLGRDLFGDSDQDGVCDDLDTCDGDDTTGDTDADGVCDDTDLCTGVDASGDQDADGVCDANDPCYGANSSGDTDGDGFCDDTDLCNGTQDNADGSCQVDIKAEAANSGRFQSGTNAGQCNPAVFSAGSPAAIGASVNVRVTQDAPGGIQIYDVTRVALSFDLTGITGVEHGELLIYRAPSPATTASVLEVWGGTQPLFGATLDSPDAYVGSVVASNVHAGKTFESFTIPLGQLNAGGRTQFLLSVETNCVVPTTGKFVAEWPIHGPSATLPGLRPTLRVRYRP